jgi:hypothetical protein
MYAKQKSNFLNIASMKIWKIWAALRRPKGVDVFRVNRDMMVSSYQFNLGKGGAAGMAVGVVLYVWDWITVRDGPSVNGSVFSTGPPTAVLRHEMELGLQWVLGASGSAFPQHGVELGLGVG